MLHIPILFSPSFPCIYFLLLAFVLAIQVDAAKITVDDTDPAIHYYRQWGQGPGCSYCWAQPDPAQAYGGTWHDAFKADWATNLGPLRMFNYTFHGTGIAIYGIVAHGAPYHGTRGSAGATWYIDGISGAGYNLPIENATYPPTYQYNAMIGSVNNLADGNHTLTVYITWDQPNFLFDYLVVTNSDPELVTTSSTNSTIAITSTPASAPATVSSTTPGSTSLPTPISGSSTTTVFNSTSLQTISAFTFNISSITKSGPDQASDGFDIPIGSSNNNVNNQNNTSSETPKRLSTGATVGIALGGAFLLLLLLLLLLWWRRQERNKRFSEKVEVTNPFDDGISEKPMIAPLGSTDRSPDSYHKSFRDIKAPLPVGDNEVGQQPVYERHKPDLPPHDGFVNYSHPYGPAYHQQQQQQSLDDEVSDEGNHNGQAPWFQHTEGSHPVEALQQSVPSSPPPHSPLNPSPGQYHGSPTGVWSYTASSPGISGETPNSRSEEGNRIILD